MEVYGLTDLNFVIPVGQTGFIEYSGNTIPIEFNKGTGTAFSPDVLTLNSDNMSSGRRRLGMLVYVYETNKIYKHTISNYGGLWSAATDASGVGGATVVVSDFGTTVKNNSVAGQNFINAWTASTIEGIGGYTNLDATWRELVTGSGGTSSADTFVTGFTLSSNTITLTQNRTDGYSSFTISLSAYTGSSSTSGAYLPLSGGTVSGNTIFQSGLTANTLNVTGNTLLSGLTAATISATTYQNLPVTADTFVTGFTLSSNTITLTQNRTDGYSSFTISLSAYTGSSSTLGAYLPLSGGTVTGNTIFNSGLTANTLNVTGNALLSGLTATTISATTYQNLPVTADTFVTGFTLSSNTLTINQNRLDQYSSFTISLSAYTGSSSTSGAYLPLSGGTVTGNTIFQSGLTANTLNVTGNTLLSGLTATTISATTYYNLPVTADTFVTGFTLSSNTITLTQNRTDSYSSFTISLSAYTGSSFTSGAYLPLSGGTVTGNTIFNSGLTANTLNVTGNTLLSGLTAATISATTYQNLPVTADTFVTGFTLSSNTLTLTQNRTDQYSSFTISLSAYTGSSSTSGAFLPLSGGTVTGGTIFQSGVTANTISQTSYIDFTTGSTNPSSVAGRVFFDTTQKALSYFDISNNQVPIAMGQQLYTRVWNASGVQIDKGKVIAITGTSNNLPSAILARNVHSAGSDRPIGLAAENIPNGFEGLVITNGILSGITLNTFTNGDTLYLSDTTPGSYVASTAALSFTARTNEIGYVLQTGSSTGKIYVTINNEDSNLSLTDKERNILEGNVISTGVYEYTGMTSASTTTVNIAPIRGWIVKNTYEFATLPDVTNLYYTGGTGITITNISSADATYVLINSASTIYQQTTFPTPQQRRENIFLGKVVHPNRTSILAVNNTVDFDVSPMSALRDLWTPLKLINEGIVPSANGANLSINTSGGVLWGNGIGWVTNQLNPDSVTISGKSPASFFYRTQTGGTSGAVSVIDPTKYDLNGVITSVGNAGIDDATNQRIYMYPTSIINILYGQQKYNNLAAAIAGIQSETFITYPNASSTGILIGILSVRNDIVADGQPLTNTDYAKFTFVSKFGELLGGTGGISTTTLQQAYDNSSTPEIVINSTLDGLTIQNGTGNADNVTNLLEGKGLSSGSLSGITSFIRADGLISGSSVSAPTISATTYYGYPDTFVTGFTLSSNTITLTQNRTDGYSSFTISLSAYTGSSSTSGLYLPLSGGTVTGNTIFNSGLTANTLNVTGNTRLSGLTASTISATTYQNVNAVTGGTYSNGTITLSGTGSVNGNTITGLSTGGGGLTWQFAISPLTASTNNGYITTGTTSIALPTVAALGSTIEIVASSDSLFTITQNTNQFIRFGIVTTTLTSGTLVSQNNGDSIRLVCTSADTVFTVVSAVGTITLN
jgi:hypothetical protein